MSKEALTGNRICFPISDISPGTQRLPEMSVHVALERTARAKVVTCPNPGQKIVEAGDFHGLIAATAIAYKQHYPLVLCPDMIWLTVLQGLAQHVANHPESLRSRLV